MLRLQVHQMTLAFDAATEDGAQVGLGRRYGGRASHSLQRAGEQAQQLQQQQQQSSERVASSAGQGSVADFAAAPWNIGAAGQQVLLGALLCFAECAQMATGLVCCAPALLSQCSETDHAPRSAESWRSDC